MTLLTDAFTAYLGPLLKKHAAGEALVWEDLEASRAASMEVMKSSDNAFVSKKIEDLHQTQVQAYREAAVKALRGWAQSEAPLEPMEENDTEDSFVERCVNSVASSWPNWRLDSAKMVVIIEIRKRARAAYAKYHPADDDNMADDTPAAKANGAAKPNAANAASNDDENNEEEEEDDDGEVEEDGEMDDDGEEEDGQAESSEPSASKKSAGNDPKAKAATNSTTKNKKKVTVRKKGTNAKGSQQRNKGPAIRGRRTGRGGGKAGASKSG